LGRTSIVWLGGKSLAAAEAEAAATGGSEREDAAVPYTHTG
jgi:hypothetical protein